MPLFSPNISIYIAKHYNFNMTYPHCLAPWRSTDGVSYVALEPLHCGEIKAIPFNSSIWQNYKVVSEGNMFHSKFACNIRVSKAGLFIMHIMGIYIYICVCVCIYIYIYTHTHIYAHTHSHIHICNTWYKILHLEKFQGPTVGGGHSWLLEQKVFWAHLKHWNLVQLMCPSEYCETHITKLVRHGTSLKSNIHKQ